MWRIIRPDSVRVFKDENVLRKLSRYISVSKNEKSAKFRIARSLQAEYDQNDSLDNLWILHNHLTTDYYRMEKEIDDGLSEIKSNDSYENSYLDLKIKLAESLLKKCSFCVRRCGVDRSIGELGWCKSGRQFSVSTFFPHMGEEPELIPSGTIFTVSCNLRCLHCQNWSISQRYEKGKKITPEAMAKQVDKLRLSGCNNVNLVGGDPTPWLHQWLETFNFVNTNVPVIWNSNSYYSKETADLLSGFIDVYLLDFKYGNNECAERISFAPKYWEACTRNHLMADKYGELIVRLLVLPGHLECCLQPILNWIASNLGVDVRVNLMWQYRPEWRANEIPELTRRLSHEEMQQSLQMAKTAGLTNFIT